MKYIKKLSILLFFVLVAGCISEDYDDCDGAFIYFSYFGDEDIQIFPEKVGKVVLYVFDESNRQSLKTITVDQNEIRKNHGTTLNLEPGSYQIIYIGNVYDNTEVKLENITCDNWGTAYFSHPNYFLNQEIPTNDSLYMAAKRLIIPERDKYAMVRDTADFVSAHIKMEVYVTGLKASQTKAATPSKDLILRNVLAYAHFDSNSLCSEFCSYRPAYSYEAENSRLISKFNILRHRYDSQIKINLEDDESGDEFYSLPLTEYLDRYPVDMDLQELTIQVHIDIQADGSVKVHAPDWEIIGLDPEI